MNLQGILIFFILFFIGRSNEDEILGCNGFVKSEIEINFSLVEIKLFTKQGSLKDHTECAPNNGYYFLPLYDKGEYILRVSPPNGWTFEPSEVALNVDGFSDSCSLGKDINFFFKGFAVTGKVVSLGEKLGPKGVKVQLISEIASDGDVQVSSTMTTDDGSFLFTPVLPGNYVIQASHSSWNLSKNQVAVKVTNGNAEAPLNSLVVLGYDVTGTVTSDNEPITGVSFVLFRKHSKMPGQIIGCDTSPLPGFSAAGVSLDNAIQICHVASNNKGRFVFPCLPPGQYIVVPHYKGAQSIKFDVHPQSLLFEVLHNSLSLDTSFQVKGFSVSGRVLWSPEGKPYPGAVVRLNQKVVTKTGADGIFHLDSMKAGMYKLLVQASDVIFEEKTVKVTPNTPQLEDLVPHSYKVCGTITAIKSSSVSVVGNRPVVFIQSTSGKIEEAKTDSNGNYCIFLPSGEYSASVPVSDTEKEKGLQFAPLKKVIKVHNEPITGVDFSQLRAVVEGLVTCLSPCPDIAVTLKAQDKDIVIAKAAGDKGLLRLQCRYTFTNVLPGDYLVSVDPAVEWCWKEQEIPLTVSTKEVAGPTFEQTGVAITIISSHDTKVKYTRKDATKMSDVVEVHKGTNRICAKSPTWHEGAPSHDEYDLEFIGCHGYEFPSVHWSSGPVTVTAISHEYVGRVVTVENVSDLIINVLTTDDRDDTLKPINSVRRLGPLTSQKKNSVGESEYKFSLQLAPTETVMLVPAASSLLFSPVSMEVVGEDDCTMVENGVVFRAERGRIVSGKVLANNAPLPGVLVKIHNALRGDVTTKTDSEGRYQFGPLGVHVQYRVTAKKEGYVLIGPNEEGNFYAHKLAEVLVEVKDKADGSPLQGVLLSLSGGENYRRNSQTGPEGTMAFLSLSPSEYYLRPMMKEYRFDPPSKMIAVNEGATVLVTLSGERVAYSVFGSVTSLSGDPEGTITVEAVGQGRPECTQFQEESTSESNGQFRIRGLQPKCEYIVRVKEGPEINTNIVRSTPEGISVKVINEDIQGLRLVVFHPVSRTDVTVYISADTPQYLRSLKAKMVRDDTTLHVVRLSDYKATPTFSLSSIALAFPSVPADGKGYYIHLESTLSQNTHTYTTQPVYFKANSSSRLVWFNFSPTPKAHDSELSQTSYLALPLMIVAAIVYYHRVFVISVVTQVLQAKYTPNISYASQRASLMDDSGSDTVIVEQITGKRKMKPRKT